jgi:hypothetical protein
MPEIKIYQPQDITTALAGEKSTKNARVANTAGSISYGMFPINNQGFPVAEIILKLGYIGFKANRDGAFGLRHIWEKHRNEIGLSSPSEIPAFIESILTPGSEVIIDHNKDPRKPLIIESSIGLLTLSLTQPQLELHHYNIITAYARKSHPGIVIATL